MKKGYHDLLRPELISTVSGLALISRVIVDGFLSGLNHSKRVGHGMEFSQFRSYQPGDDLRLLDWKMLARSGRYYIKQAEVETNISIKFILDSSKSMLHEEDGLSKMDFVRVLVASLSYLAHQQGDAVGLFSVNDTQLRSLFPKVQKQHFNRLLHELIEIENEGKWPSGSTSLNELHDRTHKELLFFITDLHEHDAELLDFIKSLKTARNEVLVFHIMGKNELEFDYKGNVTFEDLETGTKLKVNAPEAKTKYLELLDLSLTEVKNSLLAKDINYHLFRTDVHMGEALQYFLKKRSKLL